MRGRAALRWYSDPGFSRASVDTGRGWRITWREKARDSAALTYPLCVVRSFPSAFREFRWTLQSPTSCSKARASGRI